MALLDPESSESKHQKTGFTFRGKEITLSKTRGRPFSGLVKKGMERGIYPEEKRIEAVTLYAATGNFKMVSELSSIPAHTLKLWRKQDWFQDLLKEIRTENNEKIDSRFTDIIENALEQVADRVKNGDFVVTPKGQIVRKPIGAKDLSLVVAINVDKRQLLRGEPTSRSESGGSIQEKHVNRLEKLAETFESLARNGRISQIVEGETLEVAEAEIVETPGELVPVEATS